VAWGTVAESWPKGSKIQGDPGFQRFREKATARESRFPIIWLRLHAASPCTFVKQAYCLWTRGGSWPGNLLATLGSGRPLPTVLCGFTPRFLYSAACQFSFSALLLERKFPHTFLTLRARDGGDPESTNSPAEPKPSDSEPRDNRNVLEVFINCAIGRQATTDQGHSATLHPQRL
jgi:hypothetical protein